MNDKLFHLVIIVTAGVIIADLVAHAAGTTALANGVGMLFSIGTQPVNTKNIRSTTVANTNTGTMKV